MKSHVLPAVAGMILGLSGSSAAATYNCLPVEILEEGNRVQVLCAEPSGWEGGYPRDGADKIRFFAVPKSDVDFAKRFLNIAQTALISGMEMQFQYTSGDISGATFGCAADACRKPWAIGLLAPATDVRIPFAVWPSGATVSIAQGKWKYYGPFSISSARKLVMNMTGTGNADLHVRKDDPPTESDVTCSVQSTSNESCTILGPDPNIVRAVTYYVGVKGVGTSNTYKLSVEIQSK